MLKDLFLGKIHDFAKYASEIPFCKDRQPSDTHWMVECANGSIFVQRNDYNKRYLGMLEECDLLMKDGE